MKRIFKYLVFIIIIALVLVSIWIISTKGNKWISAGAVEVDCLYEIEWVEGSKI